MKNALLVFLKYPQPGHVKTRLASELGDLEIATALYRDLAEWVLTEIFPLPGSYEVILYADPAHAIEDYHLWVGQDWRIRHQRGDDLGARMHRAITEVLEIGYDRVAVIGTDCIGMNQAFIESVFDQLERHDLVIGPSNDGGYYLLGCREPSPWLFEDIAWSTETVLGTTLDRIEAEGKTLFQLEERLDIDTVEDLTLFREGLSPDSYLASRIDYLIQSRVTLDGDPDEILEKL